MNTRKKNLIIDVIALAVYLAAANPTLTGISVHEWLGLGVLVVFLVHCIAHYDWVVDVVQGLGKASWGSRGNLVFDVLILVVFLVLTVSGLGISGAVLPAFGFYADGYFFWNPLHAMAAKALLALLLVHVVVHGKWLRNCFAKEKGKKNGKGEEHAS